MHDVSFSKIVVDHVCFHLVSYGGGDNMAMTAADDAALEFDLFGPVDDSPRAATPIPYGIWKTESLLFSLLFFLNATIHIFIL